MNQTILNKKLEKERKKLNRLAAEAIKSGIPLAQDEAVMAQSRKVDILVVRIQKEEGQHRKKQQER